MSFRIAKAVVRRLAQAPETEEQKGYRLLQRAIADAFRDNYCEEDTTVAEWVETMKRLPTFQIERVIDKYCLFGDEYERALDEFAKKRRPGWRWKG